MYSIRRLIALPALERVIGEQKIVYTLRIACAMCFIGHGAFGVITKPIWCNYFAVFGIDQQLSYQLMPVVGIIDILFGLLLLFYPLRGFFAWLVIWGTITALLRPLSGEPVAEFFERAGNYGAPFMLLLITASGINMKQNLAARISTSIRLTPDDSKKIILGLRIAAFLIFLGHGWLNLIEKKGLLDQYHSFGFSDIHLVSRIVGIAEVAAAFILLFKPVPWLVLMLFLWKMGSELFYPNYEIFEFVERGGSYGILLALWFSLTGWPRFKILPKEGMSIRDLLCPPHNV
ncbi:MAG TPA: hypothetical protein VJ499_05325 [Flavisolibacter sp.]|nr:hypothetical protein [Flavisolibacter sp.]